MPPLFLCGDVSASRWATSPEVQLKRLLHDVSWQEKTHRAGWWSRLAGSASPPAIPRFLWKTGVLSPPAQLEWLERHGGQKGGSAQVRGAWRVATSTNPNSMNKARGVDFLFTLRGSVWSPRAGCQERIPGHGLGQLGLGHSVWVLCAALWQKDAALNPRAWR